MLNSSYDGEIEQWDMIDKYSMNVIYTASVDIRRRAMCIPPGTSSSI